MDDRRKSQKQPGGRKKLCEKQADLKSKQLQAGPGSERRAVPGVNRAVHGVSYPGLPSPSEVGSVSPEFGTKNLLQATVGVCVCGISESVACPLSVARTTSEYQYFKIYFDFAPQLCTTISKEDQRGSKASCESIPENGNGCEA